MKSVVIFYHKNIESIYPNSWIFKCVKSIKDQTHKDFHVIELNYGGNGKKYCEGIKEEYVFLNMKFENHIGAMNYLYDLCFQSGYDVVFNTNMDDFYSITRFDEQLKAIKKGFQLVSSNFYYVDKLDHPFKAMRMNLFSPTIALNLKRNHNIIAHPVTAMHKSFWTLKYNNLIGYEDLDLWKRAFDEGKTFCILPEFLLFYRIHGNQITKTHKLK